ncbi:MAG: hypothetical protein WD208_00400 [Dehalococcoidia bacterium]
MLTRLLGRKGGGKQEPSSDEPRVSGGLEAPPGGPEATTKSGPRRGPATIYERRLRLESTVQRVVEKGERLEYQANTIAIVDPGSALLRCLKTMLALLLLPLALLKRLCGSGEGKGNGKLKRRLIAVDRRGRVSIRKV